MNLRAHEFGTDTVISVLEPRIDAALAIRFKDRVRDLAPDNAKRVVLDLSEVDFVDSSGLGAIVAVMKLLAPATRLELCGMGTTVAKVFSLTRMDRVFAIHESVADAVPGARA